MADEVTCRCPNQCLLHPLWVTGQQQFETLDEVKAWLRENVTKHHKILSKRVDAGPFLVIWTREATSEEKAANAPKPV